MSRFWLTIGILSAGGVLTLCMGNRATSAFASDQRSGELHVIKNCDDYGNGPAGAHCTIASSNLSVIAGARVFYDQAFGIPNPNPPGGMLDSNVLLYAGTGDWAVGRCTLDGNTGLGLCTFSDGIGKLEGFSARLAVAVASGANNYSWDGRYHFENN